MTSILLTGLPRSGTTLLCRLLGLIPNVVALAEPLNVAGLSRADDADATLDAVRDAIAGIRERLEISGLAPTKAVADGVTSNFMNEPDAASGLRRSMARLAELPVGKPLAADFVLFVKHPALFTALVPAAAGRMPVRAIVRHPLDVLSSWQTIDFPVGRGRLPAAETIDPALRATLEREDDVLTRQCLILEWFFRRFRDWLAPGDTLRYEDLVADPAAALGTWVPEARTLSFAGEIRPFRPDERYRGVDRARNTRALLRDPDAFLPWYDRTSFDTGDAAMAAGGRR